VVAVAVGSAGSAASRSRVGLHLYLRLAVGPALSSAAQTRKASLNTLFPEMHFSKLRMARWPEVKRSGRSTHLRRVRSPVFRLTLPDMLDKPMRNRSSRMGTGTPPTGVPRVPSSFLNCRRPTSRTVRP
jgi:hypothetical protein